MKKLNIVQNGEEYNAMVSLEQAATLLLKFKSLYFTFDDTADEPEGWHGAKIIRPLDFDTVVIGSCGGDHEFRGYHLNNAVEYPEDYDLLTSIHTPHAALTAMLYQYICAYDFERSDSTQMTLCVSLNDEDARKMAAAFTDPSEFDSRRLNPDLNMNFNVGDKVQWHDPAQESGEGVVYTILNIKDNVLLLKGDDGSETEAFRCECELFFE